MIKKIVILFLCALMLGACSLPANAGAESGSEQNRITIVTTIFPIYDWVMQILGSETDHVTCRFLLDSGVDLHSYQPSAADIVSIASCDLFLYVGGESDEWVSDALEQSSSSNQIVLNLIDLLGDRVKTEEVVEGMQEEEHDHGEEDHEHDPEYDEHVWLSLKNASFFCEHIAKALTEIDPSNAAVYQKNAEGYIQRLNDLDRLYTEATEQAAFHTVLFGDRFPFRYLVDDYHLSYYAAFVGCSAETEASFETIVFLAGKLDELKLPAILQIESADGTIASTIKNASATKDQLILTMDSLQSVTGSDLGSGLTYLDRMAANLEVLKKALN